MSNERALWENEYCAINTSSAARPVEVVTPETARYLELKQTGGEIGQRACECTMKWRREELVKQGLAVTDREGECRGRTKLSDAAGRPISSGSVQTSMNYPSPP
eukprot:344505-Hanusia_phi.AAC.1